jgi:hypothetical protein
MSRTKGSAAISELELNAAQQMRNVEHLTWRKIGEIMHRDPAGLRRAYAKHFMPKKPGRPRTRIAHGMLLCTAGNHVTAFDRFPVTKHGRIDSWCRECRRVHNRKQKAIQARAARQSQQFLVHKIDCGAV